MKALILAAGVGKRLAPITSGMPKPLLDIRGRPLLDWTLTHCGQSGVGKAVIVVGHMAEALRAYAGDGRRWGVDMTYCLNKKYNETNNIYSVLLSKAELFGYEFLLVNGDILFSPRILSSLLSSPKDIVLAVDTVKAVEHEEMKVKVASDGLVEAIEKNISPTEAHGEYIGLSKFSKKGGKAFFGAVESVVDEKGGNVFYEEALYYLIRRAYPVWSVDVGQEPWIEIDFPQDLDEAQTLPIDAPE